MLSGWPRFGIRFAVCCVNSKEPLKQREALKWELKKSACFIEIGTTPVSDLGLDIVTSVWYGPSVTETSNSVKSPVRLLVIFMVIGEEKEKQILEKTFNPKKLFNGSPSISSFCCHAGLDRVFRKIWSMLDSGYQR